MKKIYLFVLISLFTIFLISCNSDIIDSSINSDKEILLSGLTSFDTIPMPNIDTALEFTDHIVKVKILERNETELMGGYTLEDLTSLLHEPWTKDAFGPITGIVTPYQLEILENFYGDIAVGEVITLIKNYGIYHGFEHITSGQTSYKINEEYILFLRKTDIGYVSVNDVQTSIPLNFSREKIFDGERTLIENISVEENIVANTLDEYSFNLLFYDCYTINDIIDRIKIGVERTR